MQACKTQNKDSTAEASAKISWGKPGSHVACDMLRVPGSTHDKVNTEAVKQKTSESWGYERHAMVREAIENEAAGEMPAIPGIAWPAIPEDMSSIPNNHVVAHKDLVARSVALFWSAGILTDRALHTYINKS